MEAIQNIIIDDTLKRVGDAAFEPYLCHAYCHAGHCTFIYAQRFLTPPCCDNNPVLPRLYTSYDKLEYFCLPIAELDYFDLTPTPPINQHFDLMAGEMNNGFVGERYSK